MMHKCCFDKLGTCNVCGRIKGLTKKESERYLEMLSDDYKDSEAEFWALHAKTLKARGVKA